MRAILVSLIAIALGAGAGYAYFSIEAKYVPEPFFENGWPNTSSKGSQFSAKLAIDKTFHDFGEMKSNKTHSVEFVIKNEGKSNLRLSIGGEPPRGIQLNISKDRPITLKPEETFALSVDVVTNQAGQNLRRLVILNSSDPLRKQIQLSLSGKVNGGVFVDEKVKTISRESLDSSNEVQFYLYSFEQDQLQIDSTSFPVSEDEQRLEINSQPLTADELAKLDGAKSGLVVTMKVDPGLPRNVRTISVNLITNAEGLSPINLSILVLK